MNQNKSSFRTIKIIGENFKNIIKSCSSSGIITNKHTKKQLREHEIFHLNKVWEPNLAYPCNSLQR